MDGSIDLTTEDLVAQARDLREFAGDLRQASTAAADRDLNSYGAIGVLWAAALNERFEAADRFTEEAAHAAERVADQLDAMAKSYDGAEAANAAGMNEISGDLP